MRHIRLIAHDIRSTHNVGSLLRTAEGLGVEHVYLGGYTPYPETSDDTRLPHLSRRLSQQIHKTALGAESLVHWSHENDVQELIQHLRQMGFSVIALEQSNNATRLPDFRSPAKVALLLGREVEGIDPELLELCDHIVEIPMYGQKESFNVVQAAAIALYQLREA